MSKPTTARLPIVRRHRKRSRIDMGALHQMHQRDPRGWVAFTRKGPPWQELASIRVPDLKKLLPPFLKKLLVDSYMTVNTMRAPRGKHLRGNNMVHALMAHYTDLDCYKRGLTQEQAYALLSIMVAEGAVPWPSIVSRSGRGLYAFWVFRERVPYTPEAAAQYQAVQRRLRQVLDRIGADPRALDAPRVLRVPGSWHSEANRRVEYMPRLRPDGTLVTFEPDALARTLSMPTLDLKAKAQRLVAHLDGPRTVPVRRRQRRPRALKPGSLIPEDVPPVLFPQHHVPQARIFDLCHLAEGRGRIRVGYRHFFLWRYAQCLLQLGVRQGRDLMKWIKELNETACKPPLPKKELRKTLQHRHLWGQTNGALCNIRSDTIARELGITAKEARRLCLVSIMPTKERRWRERVRRHLSEKRKAIRQQQRKALADIVGGCGKGRLPSLRCFAKKVARKTGHPISSEAVRKWLHGMGVKTNPRGRPLKRDAVLVRRKRCQKNVG